MRQHVRIINPKCSLEQRAVLAQKDKSNIDLQFIIDILSGLAAWKASQ